MGSRVGLLERDRVLSAVRRLLDDLGAGRGGALFVLGEPGLGKTAVLAHASRAAAEAGLTVGLGRGNPMEEALPFGVLTQALDAVGGRELLEVDPAGPVGAGEGRAARFYGVLRWLEGRSGPAILLALEDLHWADADSIALTAFIGRRISSLPVAIIGTLRPWPSGAGDAVMDLVDDHCATAERLAALSEGAATALLADRLGYEPSAEVGRRAFRFCAGNPLLMQQMAVAISQGGEVPDADRAPRIGEGLLLARFAGLPPAGMRCAQAAAVLGTRFQPDVAGLVAGLDSAGLDLAVESLGRSGLIGQRTAEDAEFVHPLFRQALYNDLAGPVRSRMHARAFAVLAERGMDAAAAEHAIAAGLAGDPAAIAVLERAGRAAHRAGALAAAVRNLDAAVALAGDGASDELLLAQGEAVLAGASPDRAVTIYERLLDRPGLPAGVRIPALPMLARSLIQAGSHERGRAVFDQAAAASGPGDPAAAAATLLDSAFSAWLSAGPGCALPIAERAVALARPLGGDLRTRAEAEWGQIAIQTGDPAGMAAAEPAAPWPQGEYRGPGPAGEPQSWGSIHSFALAACLTERLADADRALTLVRAAAEQVGLPEPIALLAPSHGWVLVRMGRLDDALRAVDEALSLADIVPLAQSFAGVGRAYIQLYRGALDDSAEWCKRVEENATARGEWNALLFLWDMLGHRSLREGATARACELFGRLEATMRQMGIGEPCLPPWARHGISAYLAAGRVADAERIIGWLDERAGRLPCRFPRIAAATGRAQLAELRGDRDEADRWFRQALSLHGEVDLPVEQVETLLGYGAFLRRGGHLMEARPVLAQAARTAADAGAQWLAGIAAGELRVAGGRRRRPAEPGKLTAQERRVADLAATGASNAQIARQLYLSVSTIETHLERIYAKLGIHSRRELIAMPAADRAWDND